MCSASFSDQVVLTCRCEDEQVSLFSDKLMQLCRHTFLSLTLYLSLTLISMETKPRKGGGGTQKAHEIIHQQGIKSARGHTFTVTCSKWIQSSNAQACNHFPTIVCPGTCRTGSTSYFHPEVNAMQTKGAQLCSWNMHKKNKSIILLNQMDLYGHQEEVIATQASVVRWKTGATCKFSKRKSEKNVF